MEHTFLRSSNSTLAYSRYIPHYCVSMERYVSDAFLPCKHGYVGYGYVIRHLLHDGPIGREQIVCSIILLIKQYFLQLRMGRIYRYIFSFFFKKHLIYTIQHYKM